MNAHTKKYPNPILPRDGEQPLKQWLENQGAARGISGHAYYQRLDKGLEPWPKMRKVNARVILVKL
jgi:hypothetical protein